VLHAVYIKSQILEGSFHFVLKKSSYYGDLLRNYYSQR